MSFLLAEIAFLLMVTAIAAAALTYWWARRRYIDVSREYQQLASSRADVTAIREAQRALDAKLTQALALPEASKQLSTELTEEHGRWQNRMDEQLAKLEAQLPTQRLEHLTQRLGLLAQRLEQHPVEQRLAALEQLQSAGPAWTPVSTEIQTLRSEFAHLTSVVMTHAAKSGPMPPSAETARMLTTQLSAPLTQLGAELAELRASQQALHLQLQALTEAHLRETPPVEAMPTHNQLQAELAALRVEQQALAEGMRDELAALRTTLQSAGPAPQSAGPAPHAPILADIRERLEQLSARASTPHVPNDTPAPPRNARNYDDLRRITGIGPQIEKALHRLGIFHFAQIAAWTDDDRKRIEAELGGSFRGRITRDRWVEQSQALVPAANAAPRNA